MSIPTQAPFLCAVCGAQNLGTRFCETCGQPLSTQAQVPPRAEEPPAVPVAYPVPSSGASRLSSRLWLPVLVLYVLSIDFPAFVEIVMAGVFQTYNVGVMLAVNIVGTLFAVVAGVLAGLGSLASKGSVGRRVAGAILGFLFGFISVIVLVTTVIQGISRGYSPVYVSGWVLIVLVFIYGIILFLSWGFARPFRGPGFAAVPIGLVLYGLLNVGLPMLLFRFLFAVPVVPYFGIFVLQIVTPVAVVLIAMGLEKASRAQASQQNQYTVR